jgi:hypothetical protein
MENFLLNTHSIILGSSLRKSSTNTVPKQPASVGRKKLSRDNFKSNGKLTRSASTPGLKTSGRRPALGPLSNTRADLPYMDVPLVDSDDSKARSEVSRAKHSRPRPPSRSRSVGFSVMREDSSSQTSHGLFDDIIFSD